MLQKKYTTINKNTLPTTHHIINLKHNPYKKKDYLKDLGVVGLGILS